MDRETDGVVEGLSRAESPGEPERPDGVPPSSRGQQAGPLRWAAVILLVSLAGLLLVSALTVLAVYRGTDRLLGGAAGIFTQPQPTPVLHTEAVVLEQLRGASELATAVYTMETVITESQDRTLGSLVIGNTRLLYVAHGQVRAGVDLAALDRDAVAIGEDRVTVELPPPEILDEKIDVDRSYVYDLRRSLLGPVDPELQSRAERYALDRIRNAACEAGILQEANTRAELAVRSLLTAAGAGEVRVRTQAPDPASCLSGTPEP